MDVWFILRHRELSIQFGQEISEHLQRNPHTAVKLISNYLAANDKQENRLFFPNLFTQEMRENALNDFVESDRENINYLQLLEQSQSTDGLQLPDKLRYRARKKRETLQEKLFAGSPGMEFGAEVSFKSMPDGSTEESFDNGIIKCAYSREWVEENRDKPSGGFGCNGQLPYDRSGFLPLAVPSIGRNDIHTIVQKEDHYASKTR